MLCLTNFISCFPTIPLNSWRTKVLCDTPSLALNSEEKQIPEAFWNSIYWMNGPQNLQILLAHSNCPTQTLTKRHWRQDAFSWQQHSVLFLALLIRFLLPCFPSRFPRLTCYFSPVLWICQSHLSQIKPQHFLRAFAWNQPQLLVLTTWGCQNSRRPNPLHCPACGYSSPSLCPLMRLNSFLHPCLSVYTWEFRLWALV